MSSPAVFFDRDGTLMEDVHYCADPALVRMYPGVSQGLAQLRAAGFLTFIVSNQSGIARGLITETQYSTVQAELLRQIGAGLIDASYFCPDLPGVPSKRRKPEPGMLIEAATEYDIDLRKSWCIGDKFADIECGRRAGARTILVLTGYGTSDSARAANPDFTAQDVISAIWLIMSEIRLISG